MNECVLVDGVRTPIGRAHAEKGWFRTLRPEDLLGAVYKALFDRNGAVKPEDVDVVMVGCANQSGAQSMVGRMSWLANGYPEDVACNGVEMQCASAMAAIENCARGIMTGEIENRPRRWRRDDGPASNGRQYGIPSAVARALQLRGIAYGAHGRESGVAVQGSLGRIWRSLPSPATRRRPRLTRTAASRTRSSRSR